MKHVDAAGLPSDKGSKKHFLLKKNNAGSIPFVIVPLEILTPNGQKLVEDFRDTKGEFLGGGVMKSDDFEQLAKQNPNALEVRRSIEMRAHHMDTKERVFMSTQVTSEWIAFEYSLVISQTLYGHILSIKWDEIDRIKIKKKRFSGQSTAQLHYRDKKKTSCTRTIQSSILNIRSLGDIAKACGVEVY
jgi:hypothetical protein